MEYDNIYLNEEYFNFFFFFYISRSFYLSYLIVLSKIVNHICLRAFYGEIRFSGFFSRSYFKRESASFDILLLISLESKLSSQS